MEDKLPQVGDVVFWVDPEERQNYKPDPPYVVVSHDAGDNNIYMECLDGTKIERCPGELHEGVGLHSVRVDPFLTAARKANLEAKPNGSKSNR
jgi:hypothetical protein